jgi:hypothetical protein
MAPPIKIQKLMDKEQEAKEALKEIREELRDALAETEIYKTVFDATLLQSSEKCKVPEKVAAAHALKVTMANFKKEKDADDESA